MYIIKNINEQTGDQKVYFSLADSDKVYTLINIDYFIKKGKQYYIFFKDGKKLPITKRQQALVTFALKEESHPDEYYFKSKVIDES